MQGGQSNLLMEAMRSRSYLLKFISPILVASYLLSSPAQGAPPKVDFLFPAGGMIGSDVVIEAGGEFPTWPATVWTSENALQWTALEEKGKFRVQLSTNAAPGAHWIRFLTASGSSAPKLFLAGSLKEESEKEPNNGVAQAEVINGLPVTINGRLEKTDDTDCFKVRLQAGQWLIAWVEGYGIDSPIDPLLHVLDEEGIERAFNHDRKRLDPFLAFQADREGSFVVQVAAFAFPPRADVRFAGQNSAVYRLNLSHGPVGAYVFPPAIRAGARSGVLVEGWNLSTNREVNAITVRVDASGVMAGEHFVPEAFGFLHNELSLWASELNEEIEREPNGTFSEALPVEVPYGMSGRIEPAGDIDGIRFHAARGEKVEFRASAREIGSPLDVLLRVMNGAGAELARADDQKGNADGLLVWEAPADGEYGFFVSDLLGRGGPGMVYRIGIRKPAPAVRLSTEQSSVVVEAGKMAEMEVRFARENGFKEPLGIVVEGLPEGTKATIPAVLEKDEAIKIEIEAANEAKAGHWPIRVWAARVGSTPPLLERGIVVVRGQNAPAGHLLVNEISDVWLTVVAAPEEKKAESNEKPAR